MPQPSQRPPRRSVAVHSIAQITPRLRRVVASGELDGCEAGSMREIRAHMLGELQVSPRALHTRAYWKQDVANHSDHDTGEDDD